MTSIIDTTSTILSQNTICFDTRDQISNHVPEENMKFGILHLKAINCNQTTEEVDFLFVVDCSGSMRETCADGKNKMQHILHTLKNMIYYFHEYANNNIHIIVNAFDTKYYSIIKRTKITTENISEIIHQINTIAPRGSTNIEFALLKSTEIIKNLKLDFPTNRINHIFMTDGEATDGSTDVEYLQSILEQDITNAFIGFGIQHDSSLLNGISSFKNGAYYFIDKLENAGFVYGEIIHGILYKLIHDTEIIVENGLIYNFKTNQWQNNLAIGDIVSEADKIFNIASSTPLECNVYIKGHIGNLVYLFPSTFSETADLTSHIYRQRTLQLLFEVYHSCNKKRMKRQTSKILQEFDDKTELKNKLAKFMEEMKKYMADNHLEDDTFLKNLCDDIYICWRTFGTTSGTMFCVARQTSQGQQRQYTVSSIGTIDDEERNSFQFAMSDDELQLQHDITNFEDTPYLTPQATQIMREFSRKDQDDELSISTRFIN